MTSEVVENLASFLAEQIRAVEVRRDPEPVDVCRFHRELAEAILNHLGWRTQYGGDDDCVD